MHVLTCLLSQAVNSAQRSEPTAWNSQDRSCLIISQHIISCTTKKILLTKCCLSIQQLPPKQRGQALLKVVMALCRCILSASDRSIRTLASYSFCWCRQRPDRMTTVWSLLPSDEPRSAYSAAEHVKDRRICMPRLLHVSSSHAC